MPREVKDEPRCDDPCKTHQNIFQKLTGNNKKDSCLLNQVLFDHFDQPSVTDVLGIVNFCCVLQICLAHRRYRGFIRPM